MLCSDNTTWSHFWQELPMVKVAFECMIECHFLKRSDFIKPFILKQNINLKKCLQCLHEWKIISDQIDFIFTVTCNSLENVFTWNYFLSHIHVYLFCIFETHTMCSMISRYVKDIIM